MKTSLLLGLVTLLALTSVQADQVFNYPDKNPIFSITFPDGWTVEGEDQSLSASSKDELVNMELLALDAEALDGAIELAQESLAEEFEKIKFDDPEKGELNGMNVVFLNGQTTLEGIKMAVNCCVFAPKKGNKFFMLFNVVPLEVLQKHGEDIQKIVNSIKGS